MFKVSEKLALLQPTLQPAIWYTIQALVPAQLHRIQAQGVKTSFATAAQSHL